MLRTEFLHGMRALDTDDYPLAARCPILRRTIAQARSPAALICDAVRRWLQTPRLSEAMNGSMRVRVCASSPTSRRRTMRSCTCAVRPATPRRGYRQLVADTAQASARIVHPALRLQGGQRAGCARAYRKARRQSICPEVYDETGERMAREPYKLASREVDDGMRDRSSGTDGSGIRGRLLSNDMPARKTCAACMHPDGRQEDARLTAATVDAIRSSPMDFDASRRSSPTSAHVKAIHCRSSCADVRTRMRVRSAQLRAGAVAAVTARDARWLAADGRAQFPACAVRAGVPALRLMMPSMRSRSFSKLASIGPSSTRPRGRRMRIGSTKRPLTTIS